MLSLPLRRLSRRSTAFASVLALVLAAATLAVVSAARAQQTVRPAESVGALRALADHYRRVAWDFQRAAHAHRTPTSFSYRRSTDRAYLRWTVDSWTRQADGAQRRALVSLHKRLAVHLPVPPGLRASTATRLAYSRRLTLSLRKIYPGRVTRSFTSARAVNGSATLRLWQERSATAAILVSQHAVRHAQISDWLNGAFLCIHRYEGSWTSNTGNGYYGGLQMDRRFMQIYGPEFIARWGTADNWPAWAQLETAARAHDAGRGFSPWPNTARFCGLL
jgi:Transglycosylase-like domain